LPAANRLSLLDLRLPRASSPLAEPSLSGFFSLRPCCALLLYPWQDMLYHLLRVESSPTPFALRRIIIPEFPYFRGDLFLPVGLFLRVPPHGTGYTPISVVPRVMSRNYRIPIIVRRPKLRTWASASSAPIFISQIFSRGMNPG